MQDPKKLALRPFQAEALARLAKASHLICVSPTGSGKSLIYERFAAESSARMLLVTPLLALARQQRDKLRQAGVEATLGAGDRPEAPPAGSGAWIVSPEKLFNPHSSRAWKALREWRPDFLVVDECHCLWEWGEEFRPAFREIPRLIRELGISRSLWLTATLPPEARRMLRKELPSSPVELGRFAFPSAVRLRVLHAPVHLRREASLTISRHHPGKTGIVFVSTRADTERWARYLAGHGFRALAYHAGMSAEERRSAEALVRERGVDVVAATSAFGMGMDFPHLSWVVLAQPPVTLLSLAQAVGRVGRGGDSASAYILWNRDDFRLLDWSIRGSRRNREEAMHVLGFLESRRCRIQELSRYFDHEEAPRCGHCDACAASEENTLKIDIRSASIFQKGFQAIQATK